MDESKAGAIRIPLVLEDGTGPSFHLPADGDTMELFSKVAFRACEIILGLVRPGEMDYVQHSMLTIFE
jgi:hypothetical protein